MISAPTTGTATLATPSVLSAGDAGVNVSVW
jgi:hypothetical protein